MRLIRYTLLSLFLLPATFAQAQDPTAAAPTPTDPEASVTSMFSNAYTDVAVTTWSADWDGASVEDVQVADDDAKKYTITGWGIGIDFTGANAIDASGHTNFRMDIWTPDDVSAGVFRIKLVDFPVGATAFRSEQEVVFDASHGLASGSWITLDIPLASMTLLESTAEIGQIILSGDVSTVFVDNVMFYTAGDTPTFAANAPAYADDTVLSMFSNADTDVAITEWSTGWDEADVEDIQIAGNDVKKYSIWGWGAGIDFTGDNLVDASGYTNFRMDIWTPDPVTVFRIKLVDFPAGAAAFRSEHEIVFDASHGLTSGSWITLDIPLADSLTLLQSFSEIGQMILSGDAGTVFVDNVMFYGGAGGPDAEFVMFVNGVHPSVANVDSRIAAIADADDAENVVAQFTYQGWEVPSFEYFSDDSPEGVDMSGAVGAEAGQKTLYVRLKVDPVFNQDGALCEGNSQSGVGEPLSDVNSCLALSFFDYSNGGLATDDREGRMKWRIPVDMRDGAWHELAIPMPPDSWDGLAAAQAAAAPDDLIQSWAYAGGWTGDINGWGGVDASLPGPADTEHWQAFQWDKISKFGVHFDFNDAKFAEATVQLDNLYIGDENTVLGGIKPAAMSGVTFTPQAGFNEVSWTHNPVFGGYTVYWDWDPITEETILAGEVSTLATVGADAAEFRVEHNFTIPHPSAVSGPVTLYYAVTSAAEDGTANNDVSNSAGTIENGNLASRPSIPVIDSDQAIVIYDNIFGTPTVSNAGFPDTDPFVIMSDDAADLSLKLWATVEANDVDGDGIYFYAEVMDSELSFIGADGSDTEEYDAGNSAWNYDSIELGWGSYDVRDEGGDAFTSPHATFASGTAPDYQLRITPYGDNDASAEITGAVAFFAANQPSPGEGELGVPLASDAHAEAMTDGSGAVIGWKILAYIPFGSIAVAGQSPFVPPAADAIKLVPFQISVNDAEAGGTREAQLHWSPNAGGNWWQTPSEWLPTAVVGSALATDVAPADTPFAYELGQNYPNPFNPTTTISFSLANSSEVRLEVFNLLGQRVATLVNGVPMTAGSHQVQFDASNLASGMYLMRLDAGTAFSQTRSMMLLK